MTNLSQVHWTTFAVLQGCTEPQSIDQSLGREEALTEVLGDIISNPSISEDRIHRRFATLSRNRSSKYRHRRNLERDWARPSHKRGGRYFGSSPLRPPTPDISDEIARAELVTLVRSVLPERDFQLLCEIAEGKSYRDLAHEQEISVASTKAKVFRIRKRVRTSSIGQALRTALL